MWRKLGGQDGGLRAHPCVEKGTFLRGGALCRCAPKGWTWGRLRGGPPGEGARAAEELTLYGLVSANQKKGFVRRGTITPPGSEVTVGKVW